jgi:ethanolamine transporter EutH
MKPFDQIETEEDVEEVIFAIQAKATELIRLAEKYCLTVTIRTEPKKPLAMGNYSMVCEITPAHPMYRAQS